MKQIPLITAQHLPPSYCYKFLFEQFPPWPCPRTCQRGRPPYEPGLLLKCLVVKCIRRIVSLSDLVCELHSNPSLAECLGFTAWAPLPGVERFSEFLRSTDNRLFQQIRLSLLLDLRLCNAFSGTTWALDSCPVAPPLMENNLKTSLRRKRFDKDCPPKGDPEAGLGVRVHYSGETNKQITYFWGYRHHMVSDTVSELPLWEETFPANVSEMARALPLLLGAHSLGLQPAFVTADAMYDTESILRCIVQDLHAQPMIPRKRPAAEHTGFTFRNGRPYCPANLPMANKGKSTHQVSGYVYQQFVCPIRWRKSYQRQYLICPAAHPDFFVQKGCNLFVRVSPSLRAQIPYGTELFHQIYNQRTAVERGFSRLLTLTLQNPTVRGLQAVRNHCTIAHIATLLVAITAIRLDQHDKLRWIKSLVPAFSKTNFVKP